MCILVNAIAFLMSSIGGNLDNKKLKNRVLRRWPDCYDIASKSVYFCWIMVFLHCSAQRRGHSPWWIASPGLLISPALRKSGLFLQGNFHLKSQSYSNVRVAQHRATVFFIYIYFFTKPPTKLMRFFRFLKWNCAINLGNQWIANAHGSQLSVDRGRRRPFLVIYN